MRGIFLGEESLPGISRSWEWLNDSSEASSSISEPQDRFDMVAVIRLLHCGHKDWHGG